MLDSFVPTAYRTEFTPWPVSERYATARRAGTPEAQLLPGEFTVHRSDGASMSYYLDWPENFGPADKPIALRPRVQELLPAGLRAHRAGARCATPLQRVLA